MTLPLPSHFFTPRTLLFFLLLTLAPLLSPAQTNIQWGAKAGLGMDDGSFGLGLGFEGTVPSTVGSLNLRLGAETGFYDFSTTNSSFWAIPLAATGFYSFVAPTLPELKPYLGLAIGIDLTHVGTSTSALGFTYTTPSSTDLKFHFVLRPGIDFNQRPFYAELAIGTLAGGFLLFPTFGIHF